VTVLHYVEHWLELSAGFVHSHVSRSRHRGVVVSHNALENRAAFPHTPLRRLDRLHSVVPERRWPRVRTQTLRGIARLYRASLVHVHFGYVVNDVVDMVRSTSMPLVLSLHGNDATALPRQQPRHYEAARSTAAAVIVPSQFLADVAADIGFAAERIHVIPAGIDTTFFTPTPLPAAPTVAFVGRLVEKKGIDVLLDAWPQVVAAVPEARLRVVGHGPLLHLIPRDDPSICYEPPQPERRADQVRDLLRACQVVATPSRTAPSGDAESLLLVNLEAQASGRPVVTTRHGGIPEFVRDGKSALVVPESDPDALATALVSVLSDEAVAHRLATAGPAVAGEYDVARCAARVDNLYDALLGPA
jgi:glycosyltransferase involved in cell wall biosynthesis